jgi:TrmH family RNA methyltransferase
LLRPAELDRLCVVLVNPRNPLNIGASARALSNFGIQHMRLVNAYDDAYREARSAVGASAVITRAKKYKTLSAAVADCSLVVGTTTGRHRQPEQPIKRLEQGAQLIRKQLRSGRVALLFGSEKFGLSNRDLSHCNFLIRIPTREQHPSMNLGQAVAVCMYELIREVKMPRGAAKQEIATAGEFERITTILFDALNASGYVTAGSAGSTEDKTRRLVRRLTMSSSDADLWLGMLRQILWKLRSL